MMQQHINKVCTFKKLVTFTSINKTKNWSDLINMGFEVSGGASKKVFM